MLKRNSILLVLLLLFPVVSANGLDIIEQSFTINKSFGVDQVLFFTLKNTESFSFFNVTFEDNDQIQMAVISELLSGQTVNISAIVNADADFIGDIKVEGVYIANLGSSNETKIIDIFYPTGPVICDVSIIKGDSILWNNLAERDIKLENQVTNALIANILQDQNFTQVFNEPQVITYFTSWFGFPFGPNCEITVLDDVGFILNPEFSDSILLDIIISFPLTDITVTSLINSFTMEFFDDQVGIFLIENTGTEIARNVEFNAKWFTFSEENFDLNPGGSKTISYTISPEIQFSNETNKTHSINLTVEGNFATVTQEFFITLLSANIDDGNFTGSGNLESIIKKFCEDNPNVCSGPPKIIFRDSNNSEVNVTVASKQLQQIFEFVFNNFRNFEEFEDFIKAQLNDINVSVTAVKLSQNESAIEVELLNKKVESASTFSGLTIIGIVFILVVVSGSFIIYYVIKKRREKILRRM